MVAPTLTATMSAQVLTAFYEETLTTPSEVNMARRDSPNPIKIF